jgi:hypothetical protein
MIKKYFKKEGIRHPSFSYDAFWIQETPIKGRLIRADFFKDLVKGKRVLHLGCTDWPVFNPDNNLHIYLAGFAASIDGMDIDKEGIEVLKNYVPQHYFSSLDDDAMLQTHYDICLIPETIEHVDNPALFMKAISAINADCFYITAPNAFAEKHMKRNMWVNETFVEVVHPDHNSWFSPFTLRNLIEKYSTLKVSEVYLLDDDSMICCKAEK